MSLRLPPRVYGTREEKALPICPGMALPSYGRAGVDINVGAGAPGWRGAGSRIRTWDVDDEDFTVAGSPDLREGCWDPSWVGSAGSLDEGADGLGLGAYGRRCYPPEPLARIEEQ